MAKTIFLQKDIKFTIDTNEYVNIILSPEFYWVRIFDIPITSQKEALRALPNLFEEFFNTDGYKFYIKKLEDNKYLSFAYSEEEIKSAIKNAGLLIKQVLNIYFAQNELNQYPLFKVENRVFGYQDGILVKIPPNLSNGMELQSVDFEALKLSKHSFLINNSSKYIDNKSAYILSTIFILFALVVFAKLFVINSKIDSYPTQIGNIKKEYNLMPTLFQTNSMIKEYIKVENNYKKFRQALEYLIDFKKSFDGILGKIEFKNRVLIIEYLEASKIKVEKFVKKKYKNALVEKLENKIRVRVKL